MVASSGNGGPSWTGDVALTAVGEASGGGDNKRSGAGDELRGGCSAKRVEDRNSGERVSEVVGGEEGARGVVLPETSCCVGGAVYM
jgi:hypothetical protein